MKTIITIFIAILIQAGVVFATNYPITEIEAMHLLEYKIENLKVTSVFAYEDEGEPCYKVIGCRGEDGYEGIIDAQTARVLRITRNGGSYYEWNKVIVAGHRGNVKFAPENTIPAFLKAAELGADLVEMDVRETKDGQLVIMHDGTVGRTTDGQGRVEDLTLEEIKKLDAGSWFSPEFKGTRVPTLKEVLNAIKGKVQPDLDFKAGSPEKLVQELKDAGFNGKLTMYCSNRNLMKECQQISKDFLFRPALPLIYGGLPSLLLELNPPIINVEWSEFSEPLMRSIHLSGKMSFLNTMECDTQFVMEKMIQAKPDYIQSDHLDILIPMLRARGLHK